MEKNKFAFLMVLFTDILCHINIVHLVDGCLSYYTIESKLMHQHEVFHEKHG